MDSVTTIRQLFYKNASIPPITLEHVGLSSLTTKSVADLVASSSGTRLGVAASYGKKCVLVALAFSSKSRVLLITMNNNSKPTKVQKKILGDKHLCNTSLEKHGFFMERLAAALFLDFGLHIRHAFDLAASGSRGSMAAYNTVLERARPQDSLDGLAVKQIFAEWQAFILSRKAEFSLRSWACYVAVQGGPDKPGQIDTSIKDKKVCST